MIGNQLNGISLRRSLSNTYNSYPTASDGEERYDQQFHLHQFTNKKWMLQQRVFCFARVVYWIPLCFCAGSMDSERMWMMSSLCHEAIYSTDQPVISIRISASFFLFLSLQCERDDTHSVCTRANMLFFNTRLINFVFSSRLISYMLAAVQDCWSYYWFLFTETHTCSATMVVVVVDVKRPVDRVPTNA